MTSAESAMTQKQKSRKRSQLLNDASDNDEPWNKDEKSPSESNVNNTNNNNVSGSRGRAESNTPIQQYSSRNIIDHNINNNHSLKFEEKDENDESVKNKFKSITESFLKSYDDILRKLYSAKTQTKSLYDKNRKLEEHKKEQTQEIFTLKEQISKLETDLCEIKLNAYNPPLDDIMESNDEEKSKTDLRRDMTPDPQNININHINDGMITPNDTDKDNDDDKDEHDDIKHDDIYQHETILTPLQMPVDDIEDVPDITPLMHQNDSSMKISVNGTPIATQNNDAPITFDTKEPIFTQRESVQALFGSNKVRNLANKFNVRNTGVLSEDNEQNYNQYTLSPRSPSTNAHNIGSSGDILDLHPQDSISRSNSYRTYKAKHKHKRKKPGAKKVRSIPPETDDDKKTRQNTPTDVNIMPYVPSKISTKTDKIKENNKLSPQRPQQQRSSRKLAVASKKHYKSKKSLPPNPGNRNRSNSKQKLKLKPKAKEKPNLSSSKPNKSKTNPMLNSKERKPSILHLFTSGKKHKNKSKK